MRRTTFACIVLGLSLVATGGATAGTTASLFGGASDEHTHVQLVSDLTDSATTNDASGIELTLPAGTTFADLTELSVEFQPTVGGCGGGSPRFSLTLASGKNVFVYLGPSPNFTGCTLGTWQSSGNLIGNGDTGRYDTSQVQAGTQSNTYSGALALVGSQEVSTISLVVDSGWFFTPKTQTVLVRNLVLNGKTISVGESAKSGNPAKACKAERAAMGASAFADKWGTNHNRRNAFGKCVSAHARGAVSGATATAATAKSAHGKAAKKHGKSGH